MIRQARVKDSRTVAHLLAQLGYPGTESIIEAQIARLLALPDEELMVYEDEGGVAGCISLHYMPQLAHPGDTAIISYLVVDSALRSKGIGQLLEEYACEAATKRNCGYIQVHCHASRAGAHRFYTRQGYMESPKYFSKKLG
ncbi:GNAT family N-acetyltransferase [Paenibacillus tepidiphilus]|uniref:GNAT family N-acetyltransferase n=1 Tax=Paenibacillus tepidiphilus TaxID=2608683 RepID=UPI00123BB53B|nr:GNAT family N-acetyltransferase [Paenibacillus tepidiphilus]